MSDTHRQSAILQAIEIIADKKLSQASFDKTIKAVVKKVKDKATGEYIIKYQDSEFTAYATSSQVNYPENEEVYILIPGNDWTRTKTILGSTNNKATTFTDIPAASSLYNRLGTNLIALSETGELCSYHSETKKLYPNGIITINDNVIERYIKSGNALALGMKVRTALNSSQVGGDYGLILNLKFKNDSDPIDISKEQQWENAAIRKYTVSSKDVIGNPYFLTSQTLVETLIKDINIEKFLGVDSIEIFCDGFPEDNGEHPSDIFITGIYVYGADSLTQSQLNGYVVHIDYSQTGNILDNEVAQVKVTAQLKAKGQIVTQDAEYYWFRENGTIFKGNAKYNGRAGDGWECINPYAGTAPIPHNTGQFTFDKTGKDTPTEWAAACNQRVNKIRCVIVYKNRAFTGDLTVYNHNCKSVVLTSSDTIAGENKTIYYLNNGSPTLTCNIYDIDGTEYSPKAPLKYIWSVTPQNGKALQVLQTEEDYQSFAIVYKEQEEKYNSVAPSDQAIYAERQEYKEAVDNYNRYLKDDRVQGNQYINFPIKSITGYSKITCGVIQGEDTYIGTDSIVLYNKIELQGSYSLSIDNGTQVFQYDGKGNSPASQQLTKPLEIKPLTFILIDNTGKEISFDEIVNNGYIKWLIPRENTLLTTSLQHEEGYNPITLVGEDKEFYNQGYDVFSNVIVFPYSIVQRYDKDKKNNDIQLYIKYKDIIINAYTDFTFPKDGDPGTNGTDFVGKIYLESGAERLYCSVENNGTGRSLFFDSLGNQTNQLKFALYNNSEQILEITEDDAFWQMPPKEKQDNIQKSVSHFKVSNTSPEKGSISLNREASMQSLPIVDIVRARYDDGEFKYYAEFPISYEQVEGFQKRLRIKPKTGFEYVVYSQDGTRPDYDNRYPFEIIVEDYIDGGYWIANQNDGLQYSWGVTGNLEIEGQNTNKTCSIKPLDNFDGSDLSSAVICNVVGYGTVYIPIYMILNRYGHQALNDWDGNSIELNDEGNYILAPQIGAGVKDSTNGFTGVFMGTIEGLEEGESDKDRDRGIESDDYKIGFAGYHQGARTIFLDSKTGKAQFGKNNAGRITLDPSQKINGQDAALIYSGNYPIADFIQKQDVFEVGEMEQHRDKDNQGMIIDLSTPQIGFGSGDFTVNKYGHIVAKGGGQIAGWNITDNRLYKENTGMSSSGYGIHQIDATLPKADSTVAFYAGTNNAKNNFYVTHDGFLFSKSGQIAGWDITPYQLNKGTTVGMNSINTPNATGSITISVPTSEDGRTKASQTKAFFANGDNFYVTHQGFLKSNAGRIGNWHISTSGLSNIDGSGNKLSLSPTSGIQLLNGSDATKKFKVNANGQLESTFGKIGGWNISTNALSSGNITITAGGGISTSAWGIYNDGSVKFTKGTIGGITIQGDKIGDAGGSWYISKSSVYLPNLKVTAGGAVVYNVGGSGSGSGGISGNGTHIGGSSGSSYIQPGTVRSSSGGPTLQQTIKEWVCEAIGTGRLTIYEGIKASGGKYIPSGAAVIKMDGGYASFGTRVNMSQSLRLRGQLNYQTNSTVMINGSTAKTGTVNFNNNTYLIFKNGWCIGGKDVKGNVFNSTS